MNSLLEVKNLHVSVEDIQIWKVLLMDLMQIW